MQVLTPMTLYDANGQSLVVYAPSTLTADFGSAVAPWQPPPALPSWPPAQGRIPGGSFGFGNFSLSPPGPGTPGRTLQHFPPGPLLPGGMTASPSFQQPPLAGSFSMPAPVPQAMPPLHYTPTPGFAAAPLQRYQHQAYPSTLAPLSAPPSILHPPAMVSVAPPAMLPASQPMPIAPPAISVADPLWALAPPFPSLAIPPPQQVIATGTNIYITNLPDHLTKDGLHELFSQHGTVLSCRVAKKQGQCPIGFVQFTEPGMAQTAVAATNGMMVEEGRSIRVKIADHDKDRGVVSNPSSDLYICNLPPSWSYADLHAAFSHFGKIFSLTIFKDASSGANLGSGMVRFSTTAEAMAAIQTLNHMQTPEMSRPLEVKFAESRAEKDRRITTRMQSHDSDAAKAMVQQSVPPDSSGPLFPWSPAPLPSPALPNPSVPAALPDMSAMTDFLHQMGSPPPEPSTLGGAGPHAGISMAQPARTDRLQPNAASMPVNKAATDPTETFWDSVQGMLSAGTPTQRGDSLAVGSRAWRGKRRPRRTEQ